MKAIITRYLTDLKGNTQYDINKNPIVTTTECSFPVKLGYGSFNEDTVVLNSPTKIFVKDIISIDVIN